MANRYYIVGKNVDGDDFPLNAQWSIYNEQEAVTIAKAVAIYRNDIKVMRHDWSPSGDIVWSGRKTPSEQIG